MSVASQFVMLGVLATILTKEHFGEVMIAFTAFRLVGSATGTGIGTLLQYHFPRNEGGQLNLYRSFIEIGLLVGMGLTAVAIAAASPISAAMGKPGLATWIIWAAPLVCVHTLAAIIASFLDAQRRVECAIASTELLPNILRIFAFVGAAVADLPMVFYALALWLPAVPPLIYELRKLVPLPKSTFGLTSWDRRYVSWISVQSIAGQQVNGIDMLLVGLLFSSAQAADYAVASKVASFFPFFQNILVRRFTPEVAEAVAAEKLDSLQGRLEELRRQASAANFALTGLALLGLLLLTTMVGAYGSAVPLMVTLAVPMAIRSEYAGIDSVLKMSGQGRATALFSLSSAAMLIGLSLLLSKQFGVFSIIAAMTLSACLLNPLMTITACGSGIPLRWQANATRGAFAAICMLLLLKLLPGPSLSAAVVGCALLLWGASSAFRK